MKDKFTNSENKLRSDLADYASWDGDHAEMWASIEGSLEEKKNKNIMIWWFLTAAMCLGVFGVGYWSIDEDQATSQVEVLEHIADVPESKAILKDKVGTSLTIEQEAKFTQANDIESDLGNPEYSSTEAVEIEKVSEKPTTPSSANLTYEKAVISPHEEAFSNAIIATNQQGFLKSDDVQNTVGETYAKKLVEKDDSQSKAGSLQGEVLHDGSNILKNMISFSMIDRAEPLIISRDSVENPCFVVNYIEEQKAESRESKFSLGYYRGINYHSNGYHFGAADNDLRRETETGMVGSEEGLNFEYKLGDGYVLGTGVGISKYWERFDYVENTDVELLETWVVIRYHINTNTGDTTLVKGRRTLNGIKSREIRHHNSWTMLRIPLLVGKKWTTQRLGVKVLTGISLERGIAQETRDSSDNYELFVQSDATPTNRKIGLNLELVPSIEFMITSRFSATASMPIRYAMTSWDHREKNDNSFAQKRPLIGALNIGLSYGF